jgi:hypothetical protein
MKNLKVTLVGLIGWALVPVVAEAVPFTEAIEDTTGPGGIPSDVLAEMVTQVVFTPEPFPVSPIDQLALDLAAQSVRGQRTQSVPEPTTLLLVGTAFAGTALMWWRRRGDRAA